MEKVAPFPLKRNARATILRFWELDMNTMGEPLKKRVRVPIHGRCVRYSSSACWSIGGACLLLAWDVGFTGSYLVSLFCCPVWGLACVVKGVSERRSWRFILVKSAVPVVVFGLVLANNAVQIRIAETNATRIIAACEAFRAANDRFPKSLDELVPSFIPSVPRAKYCFGWGEFKYFNFGRPMLVWCVVPPFSRRIYDFGAQRWGSVD